MSTSGFKWPWQYNFPPFFTLQPNADTRSKQLDGWCELVVGYHQHRNRSTLRIADISSTDLFYNQTLNRKLNQEAIMEVLNTLYKKGNLEWTDKTKTSCTILWKTPEQWADLIYAWIFKTGMVNTVCTLFELNHGDDTKGQEFHGLEEDMFLRALRILEKRRKAEMIGEDGVKFFM